MLLLEIENAFSAKSALRIYKETHPGISADGDIFIANKRFCYGVITSEKDDNAISYYAVTGSSWRADVNEDDVKKYQKLHPDMPKLLVEMIVHYSERIADFEKKHPGSKVLLSSSGNLMFYMFITIRGSIKDISDEEVKQHFGISCFERR